jgi:hypothetical protein
MIENMQEENEQNLLHQETTNGFIDEKIKLLEEAFNLTVNRIDEHKVSSFQPYGGRINEIKVQPYN